MGATVGQIQLVDKIQGSNFLAVQSSMEIFQRHNLDLNQYNIEILFEEGSKVVILTTRNKFENTQKILGVKLEPKTELSAQYLRTLKSNNVPIQLLDQIQGSSFPLIQTAVKVFQQHNLNLVQYLIEVLLENNSVVVVFADKNRPAGIHGSIGNPGFEVELDAAVLTVMRSNFVR
jgi:hypothetical protein